MKQLGILDSAFVNLEHPTTPQHIGGISIYDPSTAPGGFVRFKDVLWSFERRLQRLPIFRTRLVQVPGGLDRPYWIIDENFDVEFHIRHIALPAPGDWRQLCIQAARLHSRSLDMNRPLWECYIIEALDRIPNLPPGSFAIYTKMHHSLVDGAGGQSFMAALHDLEPNPEHSADEYDASQDEHFVDTELSNSEMVRRALFNQFKNSASMTRGTLRAVGGLASMINRIRKEELPELPMSAPKTRFDEPVGPHRVFDASVYPLEDFKRIKSETGTTVNDVAVCIIAGAIRRYLLAKNELPEQSLVANMPVNMRARREATDENNQVGAMMGEIHTNVAEPLKRLRLIAGSLEEAKQFIDTPFVDPMKLPGSLPPMLSKSIARFYVDRKLTRSLPMGTCTVITNVPGPNFDLYSAGARLVAYYGMGLLTPGGGLFHTVFSLSGTVSISVLSEREMMPDPEFYRECLDDSFAELRSAVLGKKPGKKRKGSNAKAGKRKSAKADKARKRKTGKPTKSKRRE